MGAKDLVELHKIKIINDGTQLGTKVFLDDQEIKGIYSVKFTHSVDIRPIVTLELIPKSLEIEGQAEIIAELLEDISE